MPRSLTSLFQELVREPFFHFLLIGAAVFGVYGLTLPDLPDQEPANRVVVTDTQTARLVAQFERIWGRSPNSDELDGMIDAWVREDILVQEALKLGMDQGDVIVRRRLAQKMEFLLSSAETAAAPDDAELRAHFTKTSDQYATSQKLAFDSVFLGETARAAALETARAALRQGAAPEAVGQATSLPGRVPLSDTSQIDAVFGAGFGDALNALDVGIWSAPVRSAYGVHLVRVTDREDARVPPFAAVRDAVAADWVRQRSAELSETLFEGLEAQYEINRPLLTATQGAEG